MVNEVKNKYIINAPAGSGKTTKIRHKLEELSLTNPKDKILCITFTNRAVDELNKNLNNPNIEISTIHSFINKIISPYFKEKEVLDFYFDFFNKRLIERINNESNDSHLAESNAKYCKEHNTSILNMEIIKNNLKEISYGEIQFTSLYYGKLSHDDLLIFASKLCEKYPVILKKIYLKYKFVFIDEYQDTPTTVLEMFNRAADSNKELKLYLLGDRMQQIYPNYDGSFESEFIKYDNSLQLMTNYRSVKPIVDILNNIYNDKSFNQNPSDENLKIKPEVKPTFIFTKNQEEKIRGLEEKFPNALKLFLMNKEKYQEIGCYNLYNAYDKMETYAFGKKYRANDILSDTSSDNPDFLFLCLINILEILDNYQKENYGKILSIFKFNNKFFNKETIKLQQNSDKILIKNILQNCYDISMKEETTIQQILEILNEKGLLKETVFKSIQDNKDYEIALQVKFIEFKNLTGFLKDSHISTQHGVKGESHKSVFFVINESKNNPNVRMYSFLELWSQLNFSLPEIESFYYDYKIEINKFEHKFNFNHTLLDSKYFEHFKNKISDYCNSVLEKYIDNKFFKAIYLNDFNKYKSNPIANNSKKLFLITEIEGILFAYKIFYVGCSRAKENIIVICDKNKVNNLKDKLKNKLETVGFIVDED